MTTLAKLTKMPCAVSGSQVVQALLGLDRAQVGLEHHVEVARLGPLPLGAAVGQVMSAIGTESGSERPFFSAYASCMLVLAGALVAVQALDERVVEDLDVTEATHTSRGRMIDAVQATTSSRLVTTDRHHCRLMFSLSSTPSGP